MRRSGRSRRRLWCAGAGQGAVMKLTLGEEAAAPFARDGVVCVRSA